MTVSMRALPTQQRARFVGSTLAVLLAGILAGVPGRAGAVAIDCDSTADFCTGDPCITQDPLEITVASCVLNFGAVDLVIAKPVEVPNNGTLSLTAETIEVRRAIKGMHLVTGAGDGADVTLTSTVGGILIKSRIDVSGKTSTGTILLDSATTVNLQNKLRSQARRTGATATGGTVTVQADTAVTSSKKGSIDVRGKKNHTAGGQASITANTGIILQAMIDARGDPGGSISLTCPTCTVDTSKKLRAEGWADGGGGVIAGSAAALIISRANASGSAPGAGSISLTADTVDAGLLRVRGRTVPGGSINVVADTLTIKKAIVSGSSGGTLDVESTVGSATVSRVDGRGLSGPGATVEIDAATNAVIEKRVDVRGGSGGEVRVSAGGNIDMTLQTNGKMRASGATGGVIEGLAVGNLTARGDFEAATGGCIGLSAGGTLDTTLATFDVTVTANCP
jgi:hypothetical protein